MLKLIQSQILNNHSDDSSVSTVRLRILRDQLFFQSLYFIHVLSSLSEISFSQLKILVIGYGNTGKHILDKLSRYPQAPALFLYRFSSPSNQPEGLPDSVTFVTESDFPLDVDVVFWTIPSSFAGLALTHLSFKSPPLSLVFSSSFSSKRLTSIFDPLPCIKIFSVVPRRCTSFNLSNAIPNVIDLSQVYDAICDFLAARKFQLCSFDEFGKQFVFGQCATPPPSRNELREETMFEDINKQHIYKILESYHFENS
ncbi:hypothetical protein GEMRC1_006698 [Eukaryota sp. GEM-RC1]